MTVAKTLADFSDTTSEFARADFIARQVLNRVATATLVEVMAVSADTVDIRPMVAQIDGAGTAIPHGTIHNVPFFSSRAGSSAIIMKPIVGDKGLAIFCHNDISVVKQNKKASNPGSRRRFDWADALYLGGFLGAEPAHYLKFDAAGEIEIKPNSALSVTGAQSVSGNQSVQGNGTVGGSLAVTGPASAATAAPGTSTTQLATTAYTTAALALKQGTLGSPGDVPGLAAALAAKQPLAATLTALAARLIGAASSSDILDRASGDARYAGAGTTGAYVGTAGVTISGHIAVYVSTTDGKVYPAVPDATSRFCIGVTTGGAAAGASVSVQVSGILTEPSWTWTMAQPVWLGASGALTQIQPTTGALFQVGVPLGATALRIEPQLLALLS